MKKWLRGIFKRKFSFVFFVLSMVILASCSADKDKKENADNNKQADEQNVDVDKGLLNVEITLPASMFEGEDIDTVIADVEKEGIKVTVRRFLRGTVLLFP